MKDQEWRSQLKKEEQEQTSDFVSRGPCKDCGSSDACATFTDGHTHCFSCSKHHNKEEWRPDITQLHDRVAELDPPNSNGFISIEHRSLGRRKIDLNTCRKWDYGYSSYKGQIVQVANYRNTSGQVLAQKIRFKSKDFRWIGNAKTVGLFGEHLWRDGGRMVVITEGEIDALSVSQMYANKYPVVSLPNGAQNAKKAVLNSLEWLEKFDSVVFCFDTDEPGNKAAIDCAMLLSPGKSKITYLPLKDANEMLQAGRGKELIDLIWGAKVYRPDGIVSGAAVWEIVTKKNTTQSIPYPWQGVTQVTRGLRTGELVTFCAGTGVGKSQVCREIAHWLIQEGEKIGYIALEESVKRTAMALIGLHLNKPVHLDESLTTKEELRSAFDNAIGEDKVVFYDHWGSLDNENLLSRIKYMIRSCGCRWIILDHLSLVVSGLTDGDERRNIDNAMTRLRSLVQETGAGVLLVSHLKRPDGNKGHEEGQRTTLAQLRGSAAIGQLSDIVIGLERDLQDEDSKNITTIRCLKNRFSGVTGVCCNLRFDPDTGRMSEAVDLFDSNKDGGKF